MIGVLTYDNIGNDWYRIKVTYTSLEVLQKTRIYPSELNSTSSIWVYGAQLILVLVKILTSTKMPPENMPLHSRLYNFIFYFFITAFALVVIHTLLYFVKQWSSYE